MSDFTLRRDRRRQLDRQGYAIIVGCGALLAVALGAVIATRPLPRDTATACLVNQTAVQQDVVVIDRTDPWTAADQVLLREALRAQAAATKTEDRLMVVPFEGSANTPAQALFDRCRPPEGKDVIAAFATPAKVERAYRTSFADPLEKSLEAVTQPANAQDTHLVAFLGNLAATLTYQARAKTITIHVFSDMAENTPGGSFVAGGRRKQFDVASFTHHFKALTRDRLAPVSVEVHLVPTATSSPASDRRIKEAWTAAFAASGVRYTWRPL